MCSYRPYNGPLKTSQHYVGITAFITFCHFGGETQYLFHYAEYQQGLGIVKLNGIGILVSDAKLVLRSSSKKFQDKRNKERLFLNGPREILERDPKIQNCSYILYPNNHIWIKASHRLRHMVALCISMTVLSVHEILRRTLKSCPLMSRQGFQFKWFI